MFGVVEDQNYLSKKRQKVCSVVADVEGELDDEAGRLGGEAKCRPKNSYERRQVAVLVSFDAARRDHFPDVRVCFLGKGGASTAAVKARRTPQEFPMVTEVPKSPRPPVRPAEVF